MADYEGELARIVEQLNRAASSPPGPVEAKAERVSSTGEELDHLLRPALQQGASDVILVAGAPATFRVHGGLLSSPGPEVTAEGIRALVLPLLTPAQYRALTRRKFADFGFARPGLGRFRANIHYQRGTLAATIRVLPTRIPTLSGLHLPESLSALVERRQGLILLTGPAGCGKSSTLAAMVDLLNARHRFHIVTIEDPIEFEHSNKQSVIEQIEVGRDTPDFAGTIRSVLRQTPDVVLVGEMRDTETIATVLTTAETGHLVLSTLHTNDTPQAVSRILDSFPEANQPQMRQQLSLALVAIIAQQLVPSPLPPGRWPAVEILVATDAVRNLIRRGYDHQLRSQLIAGRVHGMMTMEQSLAGLVRAGRITREAAFAHCFRPDDLATQLEGP